MRSLHYVQGLERTPAVPSLRERIGHFFRWLVQCNARRRQRLNLAGLDAHALKDIGISRADALTESEKSWWQS